MYVLGTLFDQYCTIELQASCAGCLNVLEMVNDDADMGRPCTCVGASTCAWQVC